MNIVEIKSNINMVDCAIRKHKHLAAWGNVESRERLRALRSRRKFLVTLLKANEDESD